MAELIPGFTMPTFDFSGTFSLLIITLGLACVAALMVYNSRYPQRKFLVRENGVLKWINYRLDGVSVMDDNLLTILFNKQKLKEDISSFPRVFFVGMGNIYMGNLVHGVLTPMGMTDVQVILQRNEKGVVTGYQEIPALIPSEIWSGKQVALRYVETLEYASAQAKRIEPITASLMMALPIVLILLTVIGGAYLMFDQNMKMAQTIASIQKENALLTQYNAELLLNVTRSTSGMPNTVGG